MSDHLVNAYRPLPVNFTHGDGCYLYDSDSKQYLDALCGISVTSLGHNYPPLTAAIQEQASTLLHTSNLYSIIWQQKLADLLCESAQMDRVFFANSGAEANEAAIKLARLYGHQQGIDKPQIVVMQQAFHGRTMATLTATGQEKIRLGFDPQTIPAELLSKHLVGFRPEVRNLQPVAHHIIAVETHTGI